MLRYVHEIVVTRASIQQDSLIRPRTLTSVSEVVFLFGSSLPIAFSQLLVVPADIDMSTKELAALHAHRYSRTAVPRNFQRLKGKLKLAAGEHGQRGHVCKSIHDLQTCAQHLRHRGKEHYHFRG